MLGVGERGREIHSTNSWFYMGIIFKKRIARKKVFIVKVFGLIKCRHADFIYSRLKKRILYVFNFLQFEWVNFHIHFIKMILFFLQYLSFYKYFYLINFTNIFYILILLQIDGQYESSWILHLGIKILFHILIFSVRESSFKKLHMLQFFK